MVMLIALGGLFLGSNALCQDVPVLKIREFANDNGYLYTADICTAFKISEHYYLTAGHCIKGDDIILHDDTHYTPINYIMTPNVVSENEDDWALLYSADKNNWPTHNIVNFGQVNFELVEVIGYKDAQIIQIYYLIPIYLDKLTLITNGLLYKGMSGSPLLDKNRKVIGIFIKLDYLNEISITKRVNLSEISSYMLIMESLIPNQKTRIILYRND
jgi:hypothetical protein